MSDDSDNHDRSFSRAVEIREKRKVRAEKQKQGRFWFGLGMFGLVGWSVAVSTLVGILIGIWIDTKYRSRYSWTLMLLFFGLVMGCVNAWFWIRREREEIQRQRESDGT